MTAIDAHVHVWAAGPPGAPPRFTPEDFLAAARGCDVSGAVLVQPAVYGADHSYLLGALRANPREFAGIARVEAGAARPDEEVPRLARLGIRGFRVAPGPRGNALPESAGMAALWRRCAAARLPVCLLIDPPALAALARLCARFPDTPVVIDHLARIGAAGEICDGDAALLCGLAAWPQVRVKLSAFYALGRRQPPYTDLAPLIRRLYDHYGPRRLMWGSDAPFQLRHPHTYAASLALIRELLDFLSGEDRGWILRGTAHELFFAPR